MLSGRNFVYAIAFIAARCFEVPHPVRARAAVAARRSFTFVILS